MKVPPTAVCQLFSMVRKGGVKIKSQLKNLDSITPKKPSTKDFLLACYQEENIGI